MAGAGCGLVRPSGLRRILTKETRPGCSRTSRSHRDRGRQHRSLHLGAADRHLRRALARYRRRARPAPRGGLTQCALFDSGFPRRPVAPAFLQRNPPPDRTRTPHASPITARLRPAVNHIFVHAKVRRLAVRVECEQAQRPPLHGAGIGQQQGVSETRNFKHIQRRVETAARVYVSG